MGISLYKEKICKAYQTNFFIFFHKDSFLQFNLENCLINESSVMFRNIQHVSNIITMNLNEMLKLGKSKHKKMLPYNNENPS